jgi:hypothetical protein
MTETGIEALEKATQTTLRADVTRLRVAEPLDRADTDGRIERAGTERHALANIGKKQIPLYFSLQGDIEHTGRYIHADPGMWTAFARDIGQDLSGESRATAHV